jgi:hypothetical protein
MAHLFSISLPAEEIVTNHEFKEESPYKPDQP